MNDGPSRGQIAFGVIVAIVVVVALSVGGWYLYWFLNEQGTANQNQVNIRSQQFQSGVISSERDRVAGYDAAVDPAQKANIKQTFCTMYLDLTPPPEDLIVANARICQTGK